MPIIRDYIDVYKFLESIDKINYNLTSINNLVLNNFNKLYTYDFVVFKVLDRIMFKKTGYNCVGVACPFVIRRPDTLEPYLLITRLLSGTNRDIFAIPIKDEYNLELDLNRTIRVVSPGVFNVDGLATVHAVVDDYNQEFILFMSTYPSSNKCAVAFVDYDFKLKSSQWIDFTLPNGNSIDLGDAGICPIPLNDELLLLTAGAAGNRSLWKIDSFLQRPLPNPTCISYVGSSFFPIVDSYKSGGLDVHHTFISNGMIIMLTENSHGINTWYIHCYFGPDKDYDINKTVPPFKMPQPQIFRLPLNYIHEVSGYGHPHYCNLLYRPLLLFVRFPYNQAGGGPHVWAHEIWACELKNFNGLYPWDYKSLMMVLGGELNNSDFMRVSIPTFNAKRIQIILNSSGAGTLTVRHSSSPIHIYNQDGVYIDESISVSAGFNRITIDSPEPYITMNLSVGLQPGSEVYILFEL